MNCEHPSWRIVVLRVQSFKPPERVDNPCVNYLIVACKSCGSYRCYNDTYERLSQL